MLTTSKISDNQIKVVKEETTTIESTHTYEELEAQRKAILDQKDRDNNQRDKELEEVEGLLAECDKLSISAKPIELIEAPIEEVNNLDIKNA